MTDTASQNPSQNNRGLDAPTQAKIRGVFGILPAIEQAILYGSRAMGTTFGNSGTSMNTESALS